jgi:hypothetical protein
MAWKADSLQGVLFTTPGAPQLDAQQLWSLATDSLPETVQRPATTPNSLSIASGAFRGYRLTVNSQLGRIDWILGPNPPAGLQTEPPGISDYDEASSQLNLILIRALASVRPVRIALVGEFGRVFESEDGLAAFLSEQTGGIWFPKPAQDCIYQINVRKKYAGSEELLMNRLVSWSGAMYHLFTGTFPGLGIQQELSPRQTVFAATLKVDVNSNTATDISAHASGIIEANRAELLAIAELGLGYLK